MTKPSAASETHSTELRQLLASLATDLEEQPSRALENAGRGALWILRQLYAKHLSEWPTELDYDQLLKRLDSYLPPRVTMQFRAVGSFASFAGEAAREAASSQEASPQESSQAASSRKTDGTAITGADVLPCLQALDNLVQWYQRDVLDSERPFDFLPEPSSTSSESPSQAEQDARRSGDITEVMQLTARTSPAQGFTSRLGQRFGQVLPVLAPFLVSCLFLVQVWETKNAADKRLGLFTDPNNALTVVTEVVPGGPMDRAGILPGDTIRQLGDFPLPSHEHYLAALCSLERGRMVTLQIERDGMARRFEVVPGVPADWQDVMVRGFVSLCCLILGHLTFARRSGGLRGHLLSGFLWLIAAEMALPLGPIRTLWVTILASLLYFLLTGTQLAVNFHIASVIPERQSWVVHRPWLVKLYYAFGLGFALFACSTFWIEKVEQASWLPWKSGDITNVLNNVILPLWAGGVMAILSRSAFGHAERRGRMQAQIIFIGLLPWSLYVAATTSLEWFGTNNPDWLLSIFPAVALCFPASIWAVLEQESRHQDRVLVGLVQRIRQIHSIDELLHLVGEALDQAFHPSVVHVFFQRHPTHQLTLGHSTSNPPTSGRVPTEFELLRTMERAAGVQSFPEDLADLPAEEIAWLERLSSHLVIPVSGNEQELVGLVVLGAKRSEETYSSHEKKQLISVAGQIALAFENIGLQSLLDERNRVQREVLDRLRDRRINLVKECEICGRCFDQDVELCEFDRSQVVLSVPVERTISERYRLERVLGKGGIGSVYEATDLRLDRRVAVKVLLGSVIDNPMIKRRFEREARIVAQLSHPNIVTLYDCGQTTVGNAFIVLELLQGFTLRAALKRHGRIPHQTLAEWLDQVLYALIAAHAAGIVHRDLKPGNVLITDTGRKSSVKMLDFGVAKIKSNPLQQQGLTVPGIVLGTHGYMAPEQVGGDEVDERADLYSVGVMVLEALTGQHPLPPQGSRSKSTDGLVSFGGSQPAQALEHVVRRCLQREPDRRYPSADALRRALIPVLRAFPAVAGVERQETEVIAMTEGTEKIEITGALEETIKELRREMRKRRRTSPKPKK